MSGDNGQASAPATRPGCVKVKAIKAVRDDGKDYRPGEVFQMEASLVRPHVAAGLVEEIT